MICILCRKPEIQTGMDGYKSNAVRPHVNPKKQCEAILCSRCCYIVGARLKRIDWEMQSETFKTILTCPTMVRTKIKMTRSR